MTALVIGIVADPASPSGDPEDARARTDKAMKHMAERIRHYGGSVQISTLGQLLAVFGADRVHEDDPERAVRAALELVGAGAGRRHQAGVTVRAGVATGAAVVTRSERGPDQVIGDVVHVAISLEQSAQPGGVLVNAAAYQATRRTVSYAEIEPSSPLERATGMVLWRAVEPRGRTGAQERYSPDTPLVEREHELSIVEDVLVRFLRDREPQFLTLVADPGLGKSRLVAELGRLVDAAPELVGWRVGNTRAYGQGTLGALVEVVKAEVGVLDDDDAQVARRKLHEAVVGLLGDDAAQAAQVAASLESLLGVSVLEQPPGQPQALFDDWAEFLAAVAEKRPLVVVLEDLQWADDTLLEFAGGLLDRVGPVPLLLVATGRPEFLDRSAGWGGGLRNAVTTTLTPLSREGTRGLLEALLGGTSLPEETLETLLDAAGGNPLYVEEYVRMLTEHAEGAAAGGDALVMPTSVQQVIAARIDTLPAADKRLLQDAAVVGETCFLGELAAVSGAHREDVHAGLRRLERRGFLGRLRVSSVGGETEYAFRHNLIREVAYNQLLRAERADRHQRAAAWIQSLGAETGTRTESLVYHYRRALELTRAAGQPTEELVEQTRLVIRAAGDQVRSVGVMTAAARLYEQALELWPQQDPERAELLFRLGEAQTYGEHAGEQVLTEARDALEAAGRLERAQEADVLLALGARSRNDGAAAEQHLERALNRPTSPSRGRALAQAARAVDLMIQDQYAAAVTAGQEALRTAQQVEVAYAEGLALEAIGGARLKQGDPGGQADLERCIAILHARHDPAVHYCRFDLAWGLWWLGDLDGCQEATTTGRRAAAEVGDGATRWFDAVQAGLDYAAGRWDAVLGAAEQILGGGLRPEDGYLAPWYQVLRARIRLARDRDLDAALADADAALKAAAVGHDLRYRQVTLALRGRLLLALGHDPDAAATLDELLAEQRAEPWRACATPDLALLVVDLDRPAGSLPDGLPPTRWHEAVRAVAARDFAKAAELYATVGSAVDEQVAEQRTQAT